MAVIGQIRKRSGLLIIIVGIALAAFVLGDFLQPRSGRRSNDIGVIAGENIPYPQFAKVADEQMELLRQNQNKDRLTPEEIFQTRLQAWNQMIGEVILGNEYEALGLTVSPEELFDQVQGTQPHAYILQYFRDPETNQYNPELVRNYLRNLDNMEQEGRDQWLLLEKAIKEDRLTQKYRNLMTKAFYMPKALLAKDYEWKTTTATARVLGLRFNSIPDEQLSLTDADYEAYYNKHKHKYEQEESRDLDYVVFDVQPSAEDIAAAETEINQIYREFGDVEEIEAYVNANSDERYDSTFKMQGELSFTLDTLMFQSEPGALAGPYFENGEYKVARLIAKEMRPDSMRASHILIAYRGAFRAAENVTRSKTEAEALADSLKAVVQTNPGMFEALARQYSEDGTAMENGGDLDWFADQTMVGPFNQAVLEGNVGDITEAETPFGYHIIQITGKKAPVEKVRVAIITRTLEPSAKTYQDAYTQASIFAGENNTLAAFNAAVAEQGLNKRSANNLKKMDNRIPGIDNPRAIIQWAFMDDTKQGMVSPIFDVDGSYVVAALRELKEDGIPSLAQLKPTIEPLVMREKKGQMLLERVNAVQGDLNQIAAGLESRVDTVQNISFMSANLPGFGPEPRLIGSIFASEPGQQSEAHQGENAVYLYVVDRFNPAPPKEDYTVEKQQLVRTFENKVNQQYFDVLQKLNSIKDYRHLYF
jgi:peptidyl-prolyl cis-trans isomerase D